MSTRQFFLIKIYVVIGHTCDINALIQKFMSPWELLQENLCYSERSDVYKMRFH